MMGVVWKRRMCDACSVYFIDDGHGWRTGSHAGEFRQLVVTRDALTVRNYRTIGRRTKFRIMSRDDTLLAVTRSSCHDTHNPRDMVDGLIHAGDTVLLRLPTGDIKSFKLEANSYVAFRFVPLLKDLPQNRTVNLGKFGIFPADALVNQPYGLTYEVVNKTVSVIPPPAVEELGKIIFIPVQAFNDTNTEDTDATNELINDGQFVQPLTGAEIEALKQSGVHATVTTHILRPAFDLIELACCRKSSGSR